MHGIAATNFDTNRLDIFWTDPNFQMLQRTWDGTRWLGWYELGGTFASAPAAVASMARPPLVNELSPDVAPGGSGAAGDPSTTGSPPPDQSGGAAPGRIGPVVGTGLPEFQRLDVFGLGLDYSLYTKTLWNAATDNRGAWYSLGGVFTSAPAAIAWNRERIEVFGLGTDRALFQKTWNGTAWSADWARLGGTFSSVPSLVSWGPNRLDVFVRGTDYTLRHRSYDGSVFTSDWQNLGGSLASEPVAVSWGPNRIDVFAVFHDGLLWHRWWDGSIWNDWESLGGSSATGAAFIAAPSAVAWAADRLDVFVLGVDGLVYHVWWSGDAWAGPEQLPGATMTSSPTARSTRANRLDVFAPGADQNVYHKGFDGTAWQPVNWDQLGGHVRLPTRYRFSVDYVTAQTTRSLNTDTDTASASITAGNRPTQTATQSMGDIGGTHPSQAQTNLLYFDPVTVELCEAVIFDYLIVNNGHAGQQSINAALSHAGETLSDDAAKSVAQQLGAGVAAITSVELAGSIATGLGTLLVGAVVQWLMQQLESVVFADCDGMVAAELFAKMGTDVHRMTANGPYTKVTQHPGTDSATGCGENSQYEVTWSITRV